MKRRTTTIIGTIIGLIGFSAPVGHADGPNVTGSANCETVTVNASGFPTGTAVYVGLGAQPPYGFTVGSGIPWQFHLTDDGGYGTLAVIDASYSFPFIVDTQAPGEPMVRWVDLTPDCSAPPATDLATVAVPEVAGVAPILLPVTSPTTWTGVSLAPPW